MGIVSHGSRWVLCVAFALAATGARAAGVESVEGCDVNFFRAKWVKENNAKVSWSGGCKKGLAEGSGVVFLTAPDGTWARFVGTLVGGWAEGDGDYRTTDGQRKVGRFASNQIAQGRLFDANGRLAFEGTFENASPLEGTYWFEDGTSARGTLDPESSVISAYGTGIRYAAIQDAGGRIVRWVVGGTEYRSQADYDAAVASYVEFLRQKREAERQAEQQRLAAEQAARDAEAERTYQAITGALLGAANVYAQQQQAQLQNQLQSYTAPQVPIWTPPAPTYTAPAPVYQAPSYAPPAQPTKMHRPEYDASGCVKVEQNAQGDGYQFVNRCNATVGITWCVVGNDCNPGYSNTWDLGVGRTWPIARGSSVNWAACLRPASLYATTEMSRRLEHRCVTD